MNKIFIAVLTTTLFFIFCNCERRGLALDTNQVTVNLISDNRSDCDTLFLSSMIDSVSIVRLESKENCMIGMIRDIKIYKDLIFISQYQQSSLLIFNSNGNFVRKIGNVGRGHGEYLGVASFDINPTNDQISILDNTTKKVSKYSLLGEFEGSFPINDFPQDMVVTSNGEYIFYDPLYQYSEYNSGIWMTDPSGVFKKQLLSFKRKEKWSSGVFPHYYQKNNNQASLIAKDDYLYVIENGEITPVFKINVDIKIPQKIKRQSFVEKYEPYSAYAIMNYFNTNRFCAFTVLELSRQNEVSVIIDRVNSKTYYVDKKHPFVFDSKYGPVPFYSCSGNKIIGVIDPSSIMNNEHYKKIFPNYDMDSNPILVLYNFKD